MAITQDEIVRFKKALDESARPLFLFDDDPDGVSSFLLIYRYKGEGKGVIVKSSPELSSDFVKVINEYQPDAVFILDKPMVSQDFVDEVNCPIYWLDHHEPCKVRNVRYFNPRVHDDEDNRPTSYWAYRIVQQDLPIAMVGIVGDYQLTELAEEYSEQYPHLLPADIVNPGDALYQTKIGEIARIYEALLKGTARDAMKYIKILTRIDDPQEILQEQTPRARYIMKRYRKIREQYMELLNDVKVTEDKVIIFTYQDNKMSFTRELSNELIYRHPDKIIIIAREKNGEMKTSFRSKEAILPPMLNCAMEGIIGNTGGHNHACGGCIPSKDWERFLEQLKLQLK